MGQTKTIQVIIIGAGLATAYGLQPLPGVHLRIFDKREDDGIPVGFPLRLSPDGRQALNELLTPQDHTKLLRARNKLPACHDGITMLDSSGNITYRKVDSPGEKCLMERQDLVNIFKAGLSPSTAREVDLEDGGRASRSVRGATDDDENLSGERVESWRQAADWARSGLAPSDPGASQEGVPSGRPGPDLDREKWLANDEQHLSWVSVEYGKSVKAITKSSKGWKVIMWDGETATCDLLIGADGMFSTVRRTLYPPRPGSRDPGFEAHSLTIINLRATSPAVRRWVRDADGMNMVYGKGWSAALGVLGTSHAPEGASVSATPAQKERDSSLRRYPGPQRPSPELSSSSTLHPEEAKGRPSYGTHDLYVALTLPHPQGTIRQAISGLSGAKQPGTFLADLLADDGLSNAQASPLWTARRTCAGGQRAVLIGDASHGVVPYCGAGASAGLKDAAELVAAIQNHLIFGGDLDFVLDEFYAAQRARNDPVIKMSRRNLWLVQGDNLLKRMARSVAFRAMERLEETRKARREADEKLAKWKGGLAS